MLKFFRRIRRRLIDRDNLKRYLIYAMGEIALVVVGILIALQINNWNQENKAQKFENDLLTELRQSIIYDYSSIERILRGNQESKSSCQIILRQFDNDLPYLHVLGSRNLVNKSDRFNQ